MKNNWTSMLTTLALLVGMSGMALAQDWGRDRDRDNDRDDYYRGYYTPYGYQYYGREAYAYQPARFGYRDGVIDGRNDAATGHSFRPTYDRNYRHATDGFNGGNLGAYREAYRQAYLQGYRAGYGQHSGWRWGW